VDLFSSQRKIVIIDHVNTHLLGGAATAARRLHAALLAAGVISRFYHAHPDEMTEPDATLHPMDGTFHRAGSWQTLRIRWHTRGGYARLKSDWQQAMQGRPAGLEQFSLPQCPQPTPYRPDVGRADVLHLHWIAHVIDYPSFFASLPSKLPIVWTLHDMNPFTGGCHYSGDCDAYVTQCRFCPQLGSRGANDVSAQAFRVKQYALRRKNLHVVAPSRWLADQARRSRILGQARSIRQINYGLDLQTYAPQDKAASRRLLGLPEKGVVVAFGAESIDNHRKGFAQLRAALAQLEHRTDLVGLVFGEGQLEQTNSALPWRHVGFVSDPRRQAIIYSAADIYVLPSLEDNSPQTGLEALACGTPVVGFDVGGIPDYVRPRETGLLAKAADTTDLAQKIAWLADRPTERLRMGESARTMMLREFRSDLQASAYVRLYHELLSERVRRAA
jgi:glycosyltransferase involved in cell wall biosynthesis